MSITHEQVRWVAHLARLELSTHEIESLARDLGSILNYIDRLREVETDGVEPLAHALDLQNVFRADEPSASLTVDAALANAPARKGDFYAVPPVME